MAEKMLITQALDEKDLLLKKISDKIAKANFIDMAKNNSDKTALTLVSKEEFSKDAQAAYQQISDLMKRYQVIDFKIIESNSKTFIETSYGKISVACAISLRGRLRGLNDRLGKMQFENNLRNILKRQYESVVVKSNDINMKLQETAENMRISILGKDSKFKEDKPLDVVEAYIKENTMELIDPLDILKKVEEWDERNNSLLTELDTQIKVSNATTFIEV